MFAVPNTALIHSATRTRTWRDFPCFERTCCLRYREHILLSIASLLRLVATGFSGLSCTLSSYFPEAGVGAECAVIGVFGHHSSILAFCTPLEPFEFDKVSLGSGYFAKYLRLFEDYNEKPRLTQVCHFPNNF